MREQQSARALQRGARAHSTHMLGATVPFTPSQASSALYAGSPPRHGSVTDAQTVSAPRSIDRGGKAGGLHGKVVSPFTLHPLVQ